MILNFVRPPRGDRRNPSLTPDEIDQRGLEFLREVFGNPTIEDPTWHREEIEVVIPDDRESEDGLGIVDLEINIFPSPEGGMGAVIERLFAYPVGHGLGAQVLDRVTIIADELDVWLFLTAAAQMSHLPVGTKQTDAQRRLKNFYARFGFKMDANRGTRPPREANPRGRNENAPIRSWGELMDRVRRLMLVERTPYMRYAITKPHRNMPVSRHLSLGEEENGVSAGYLDQVPAVYTDLIPGHEIDDVTVAESAAMAFHYGRTIADLVESGAAWYPDAGRTGQYRRALKDRRPAVPWFLGGSAIGFGSDGEPLLDASTIYGVARIEASVVQTANRINEYFWLSQDTTDFETAQDLLMELFGLTEAPSDPATYKGVLDGQPVTIHISRSPTLELMLPPAPWIWVEPFNSPVADKIYDLALTYNIGPDY